MSTLNTLTRRKAFSILLFTPLAAQQVFSAPAPAVCSIRLVNAVGSDQNIVFKIGGKTANEDGYASGKSSGWIGQKPGRIAIQASHPDGGTLKIPLKLAAGDGRSVVVFLKDVPPTEEGAPSTKTLDFISIPLSKIVDPKSKVVTLLSLAPDTEMEVTLGKEDPKKLKQYEPATITLPPKTGVAVELKQKDAVVHMLTFDPPGPQVVVFYPKKDGLLGVLDFREPLR